jgi:Raf kinase inhibitor-like YbhB/YbcL family protein
LQDYNGDSIKVKEVSIMESIKVRSGAFTDGGQIPAEYGREGENLSPQLSWDSARDVKSWILIMDDPDAPNGTFTHWVLYNLPGDITSLPPGASGTKDQLHGALEGKNSRDEIGYVGPYPPSGTHRYFFKLYGLDSTLNLNEGAIKEEVLAEIDKHKKIVQGELMGTYAKEAGKAAKP